MLAALSKSENLGVFVAMKDIYNAEDIDKAWLAIAAFEWDYGRISDIASSRSNVHDVHTRGGIPFRWLHVAWSQALTITHSGPVAVDARITTATGSVSRSLLSPLPSLLRNLSR